MAKTNIGLGLNAPVDGELGSLSNRAPLGSETIQAKPQPEIIGPRQTPVPFTLGGSSGASGGGDVFLNLARYDPRLLYQGVQGKDSLSSAMGYWTLNQDRSVWDLMDELPDRDLGVTKAETILFASLQQLERGIEFDKDLEDVGKLAEIKAWLETNVLKVPGDFGFHSLLYTSIIGMFRHAVANNEIIWDISADGIVPREYIHAHNGLFNYAPDGELIYGWPFGSPLGGQRATPGKYITARNSGLYSNPYGHSILWPCRWYYAMKKAALMGWITFGDNSGSPFLVLKIPNDISDKDEWESKCATALKNLGLQSGMVLPLGIEIEAVRRSAGQTDTPQEAIVRWCDAQINAALLGSTLASGESEKGAGSRAMAQTHSETMEMVLTLLAVPLVEAINRDLIDPAVVWNFGEQYAGRVRFFIETEDAEDSTKSIALIDAARRNGIPMTAAQAQKMLGINPPASGDLLVLGNEMYQYHITSGAVTINEIRASLGLGPLPDGDRIPDLTAFLGARTGETSASPGNPFSFAERLARVKKNGARPA